MTNAEAITKLQSLRNLRGAAEAVELAIQALKENTRLWSVLNKLVAQHATTPTTCSRSNAKLEASAHRWRN